VKKNEEKITVWSGEVGHLIKISTQRSERQPTENIKEIIPDRKEEIKNDKRTNSEQAELHFLKEPEPHFLMNDEKKSKKFSKWDNYSTPKVKPIINNNKNTFLEEPLDTEGKDEKIKRTIKEILEKKEKQNKKRKANPDATMNFRCFSQAKMMKKMEK
jgi:hypothetical protein